ncbi:MAG: MucB/RseB C-terminal domain-containing protein [Gammaproteobacteria bacterium]|nr:MucB/RseB C-terminal domain-containing protein [Gammaproteobacteria bacterium]
MPLPRRQTICSLLLLGVLFSGTPALAESKDPSAWLERMRAAVDTSSYEGTVVRVRDGEAEALKVVRTFDDGVIREKVVAQEGDGLEIIRNGNEVHCILPDKKSVLVEKWNDQSTLFSTLPSSDLQFGSEYDVSLVREERVAGRKANLLAIRPHDGYRYGYRIWLDVETGFPLQTKLIDADGVAIEQIKFAEVDFSEEIHASALAPSHSTENFRWLNQSSRHVTRSVETDWTSESLPQGFRVVSSHEEQVANGEDYVVHILYSDGLASVSVFIAARDGEDPEGVSSVGGSNAYSAIVSGHHVTAVGKVPAMTVQQIATTMRVR